MRFDPQCDYTAEDDRAATAASLGGRAGGRSVSGATGKAVASAAVVLSSLLAVWIWRQQTSEIMGARASEAAPSPQRPAEQPTARAMTVQRQAEPGPPSTEVDAGLGAAPASGESKTAIQSASGPATDEVDVARLPQRSDAVLAQGKEMLAIGRSTRAIELLSEAVRLDPQSAEAHYNLGLAYVLHGDMAAARGERDVLRELDRSLASLLGNLVR